MKYLKRIIYAFLTFLVFSFVIFYFWASSSFYSHSDYYKIVNFKKEDPVNKDTFSIMTYNIGYLSGLNNNLPFLTSQNTVISNLTKAINIISTLNPDFIGFQEIDFCSKRSHFTNQFDSIAKDAGFRMGAMAVNWDKRYVPFPYWPPSVHFGRILSGQAILSKYDIKENMVVKLPKPASNAFYYNAFYLDRLIQSATIYLPANRIIRIINVHLEAFDQETRELQSGLLVKYLMDLPDDLNYLLIGDFNSRPPYNGVNLNNEETIRNLLAIGLVPAVDEKTYNSNPEQYLTFNSRNPVEKIDYIFYNPEKIRKIDTYVVKDMGDISDHLPVIMKFVLKN